MKTIEERAERYGMASAYLLCSGFSDSQRERQAKVYEKVYERIATEQKAIDEANPSDELIMRILNAIGYEEESWIPFVREHLKTMEK